MKGLLVLEGPSRLLGSGLHYHAFILSRLLTLELDAASAVLGRYFQEALSLDWALLGLLEQDSYTLVEPAERRRPFLEATARAWPKWVALGRRFSQGLPGEQPIWEMTLSTVYWCVGQMAERTDTLPMTRGPNCVPRLISVVLPHLRVPAHGDGHGGA
ncbi:MAG: hypothetical protein HY906_23925 [Deltaproteobacteria bacterium]|nr:hypothetical protein [Deltaproteobacteria bacterium]